MLVSVFVKKSMFQRSRLVADFPGQTDPALFRWASTTIAVKDTVKGKD